MKKILLSLLYILVLTGIALSQEDTIKGNQRAFYECSEPIKIDKKLINLKPGKLYFQFNTQEEPKNLKSKDFVWLKNNPKGYFTAYLVNNSDSTISIKRQDGSLIMIREALDKKGNWRAIEYWVYSGCGNSYFNPLKLKSGKYVMIPIKKYSGSFKTKIRLKLKNGENIFYSDSYDGAINKSIFNTETETVYGILYHGSANYLDDE